MSFVEGDYAAYLAEQGKSAIAVTHDFRLVWRAGESTIHAFFEGDEDPIFLMPELRRQAAPRRCVPYVCGGKAVVRDVRDEILALGPEYDDCLFFVDRDYDDLLDSQIELCERMYVSDKYSIENEVAAEGFLQILLDDFINISPAEPGYGSILRQYRALEDKFSSRLKTLTAWILAGRDEGLRINLSNLNGLQSVMRVTADTVEFVEDGFENFRRRVVGEGEKPSLQNIRAWRRVIEDLDDADLWIRGKFKIWFFRYAVNACLRDAGRRRRDSGGKLLRVPSAVQQGRFFELAAGRVPPPPSLVAFFERNLH